jgi:signal transduction histidine kinase
VSAAEDELQSIIERQRDEIALLSQELEHTNKGVVALYAELDDNARQLRRALELRSRFLSYMSHEFRTPLASISSIGSLLLNELDGPLTAEQRRQLEFVRGSVSELTDMVDDLLDLAKVDAGRIAISPEWFEMVDLFAALRGMFKPIVDASAVALIFEEPQGIPRIYSDDKKLSQILRNFISNALKFTKQGEVRISAQLLQADTVEFAVADTGVGIAAEQQRMLFTDFVQIDNPMQKRLRGSGLGLSLSKKLAELLGGRIAVDSEPGRGSRFGVVIPTHYRPAREAAEAVQ